MSKEERFCIRCGMSNQETTGWSFCTLYGKAYGRHLYNKKKKVVCNQCKSCAVENTAVLDCADKDCKCHKV